MVKISAFFDLLKGKKIAKYNLGSGKGQLSIYAGGAGNH